MTRSPYLLLFGLCYSFLLCGSSFGQSYAKPFEGFRHGSSGGPIEINSDELEVLDGSQRFDYRGNVRVTQGESTITSDLLTVFYSETSGARQLSELHFEGDVLAVSGGVPPSRISAGSATYIVSTDSLILEDNVFVSQGDSHAAQGCKLTIDLGTNHAEMSACGGQVNTIIDPNQISDQ